MSIHTKASLEALTTAQLLNIYNQVFGKTLSKLRGSKASNITAIIDEQSLSSELPAGEYRPEDLAATAPAPVAVKPASKPVAKAKIARGPGAKTQLRALFSKPAAALTADEITKSIPGVKWSTIVTMVSDLRNPKYAGPEGVLNIVRGDDDKYRVVTEQVSLPKAA